MFQMFIDEKQAELLERTQKNTIVKEQFNNRNINNQNNDGTLETEINCVNSINF
jgi:hypothetical protein